MLTIKRLYAAPAPSDGYRILVDRLWPRGVSKDRAAIDLWLKEIAPSPELRTWFNHDPDRFADFSARYIKELADNAAVQTIQTLLKQHATVTLVYAARDTSINHAAVLRTFLLGS